MGNEREWLTERLLIRQFRADDLDGLFELQSDPIATHFVGGPWDLERTRTALHAIVDNYSKTGLEWMAVTRRADAAVMGVCWLKQWGPFWRDVLPAEDMELGYRYARQYWGQGYATEAARAMVTRGFDELGLDRVAAIVDIKNLVSERVLQKIGMTPQREVPHKGIVGRYYLIGKSPR